MQFDGTPESLVKNLIWDIANEPKKKEKDEDLGKFFPIEHDPARSRYKKALKKKYKNKPDVREYDTIPAERMPLRQDKLEMYVGKKSGKTRIHVFKRWVKVEYLSLNNSDPFELDGKDYEDIGDYKQALLDEYGGNRIYQYSIKY